MIMLRAIEGMPLSLDEENLRFSGMVLSVLNGSRKGMGKYGKKTWDAALGFQKAQNKSMGKVWEKEQWQEF